MESPSPPRPSSSPSTASSIPHQVRDARKFHLDQEVKVVDDYTVQIITAKPFPAARSS